MTKMTRRESVLALASALATGRSAVRAAAQAASGSSQTPPAAPVASAEAQSANRTAQPSPADLAFEGFVDRYFDGFFHYSPSQATRAGSHQYDAELPAYSN